MKRPPHPGQRGTRVEMGAFLHISGRVMKRPIAEGDEKSTPAPAADMGGDGRFYEYYQKVMKKATPAPISSGGLVWEEHFC